MRKIRITIPKERVSPINERCSILMLEEEHKLQMERRQHGEILRWVRQRE